MVASLWESLAVGALAGVVAATAVVTVALALVVRAGRRRWRALRTHGAVLGATAAWDAWSSRRRPAPTSPEEVAGRSSAAARRALWAAVDRAGAAVSAADRLGAPTADLDGLCRRLRSVAEDLDPVLRVDPSGPVPDGVAGPVAEVVRAAVDLRRAADAAAGDAGSVRTADLAGDVAREVGLLEAGLAAVRAALPGRRD